MMTAYNNGYELLDLEESQMIMRMLKSDNADIVYMAIMMLYDHNSILQISLDDIDIAMKEAILSIMLSATLKGEYDGCLYKGLNVWSNQRMLLKNGITRYEQYNTIQAEIHRRGDCPNIPVPEPYRHSGTGNRNTGNIRKSCTLVKSKVAAQYIKGLFHKVQNVQS